MDYEDVENLRYTLQGVDLVISTISGNEQLNLIDAARRARVRLFVPSEFEGDLNHRPANDPLDRGSQSALQLLESWSHSKSQRLRYTVFSCGVFMERFGPGGLQTYGIGAGCGIQGPDDYLVNIQEAKAEIIPMNSNGAAVRVSLTSVYDVAQFITAAIELGLDTWPKEFRMRGDSVTVRELVETCSNALGGQLFRHFYLPAAPLSLGILTGYSSNQSHHSSLPGSGGPSRGLPSTGGLAAVVLLPEAAADSQRALPRARIQPQRSHPGATPDVQEVAGECLGAQPLSVLFLFPQLYPCSHHD